MGAHQVQVEDDLIVVIAHGDWMVADANSILDLCLRTKQAHGVCHVIVDLSDSRALSPEVRRAVGEFLKRTRFGVTSAWVVGASVAMRTVVTLLRRITSMFSGRPTQTNFVDSIAEARMGLAARR